MSHSFLLTFPRPASQAGLPGLTFQAGSSQASLQAIIHRVICKSIPELSVHNDEQLEAKHASNIDIKASDEAKPLYLIARRRRGVSNPHH